MLCVSCLSRRTYGWFDEFNFLQPAETSITLEAETSLAAVIMAAKSTMAVGNSLVVETTMAAETSLAAVIMAVETTMAVGNSLAAETTLAVGTTQAPATSVALGTTCSKADRLPHYIQIRIKKIHCIPKTHGLIIEHYLKPMEGVAVE